MSETANDSSESSDKELPPILRGRRRIRRFEQKVLRRMFAVSDTGGSYWSGEDAQGICELCGSNARYRYDHHAAVLWQIEEPEQRQNYMRSGFVPAFPPRAPRPTACAACCLRYYLTTATVLDDTMITMVRLAERALRQN